MKIMLALVEFVDDAGLTCFGEAVEEDDDTGNLDVYPIQRTAEQEGRIWRYEEDYMTIKPDQVVTKITMDDPLELRAAWKDLGFVAAGDGHTLCLVEDEDKVEIALYSEEPSDDEGGSENPAMKGYESDDFVVPDNDDEVFTFASVDDTTDPEAAKFIRETHEAVAAYEHWEPKTEEEKKIKAFIDAFEARARAEDSDARLSVNKQPIDLSHPPA